MFAPSITETHQIIRETAHQFAQEENAIPAIIQGGMGGRRLILMGAGIPREIPAAHHQ